MSFEVSELVVLTRENEATPGVVVGDARDRVVGINPTWDPVTSGSHKSALTAALGGIKSIRPGARGATVTIPSELLFGLNDREICDFLRESAFPTEITVADASLTFDQSGTHEDTSTGPVITAAASTFDDLVNGDCIGAMIEVSGGAVDAANKWPRRIKALAADGSKIDLEPAYTTGSASEISEPLTDEGPVTGTIRAGSIVRDRGTNDGRDVNFEWLLATGSYQMVVGAKCGTMKISADGNGIVGVEFGYEALDYHNLTAATQGNGTVNPNTALDNQSIIAGGDLAYVLVGAVTQLANENLTSFNIDGTGNLSIVDNVQGATARKAIKGRMMEFSGNLKLYHAHAISNVLQTLARSGNLTTIDMKFVDPDGNTIWIGLPAAMIETGGSKPGSEILDGDFPFSCQLGEGTRRSFIYQKFAA